MADPPATNTRNYLITKRYGGTERRRITQGSLGRPGSSCALLSSAPLFDLRQSKGRRRVRFSWSPNKPMRDLLNSERVITSGRCST